MQGFLGLTKRNLLIFFKDRQSVIFSLLTSIIVLVLYLLFLKGSFVDGINGVIDQYQGLGSFVTDEDVDIFANLILLTGILGSAMITIPYTCLQTLVKDRENKVDYDILSTPIKRGEIILSYFISAAISAIIINAVILVVGLLILRSQGEVYLEAMDIVEIFGIVVLGSISSTAFFMIIMLWFKSTSSSGAFFGMLSAAAGFVIGAYIPISQFSDSVQTVCNIFPASQITIILRNKLLNGVLESIDSNLAGIDNGMFVNTIKDLFSFKAHLFGGDLEVPQMLLYVSVGIIICIVLQVLVYVNTYKKK